MPSLNELYSERGEIDSYDGAEFFSDASQASLEAIIAAHEIYGLDG